MVQEGDFLRIDTAANLAQEKAKKAAAPTR
jgi:hypothetical protein